MQSLKTNIVMLAKNRDRLTKQAVESLYKHTRLDQFNLTLIDDASTYPTNQCIPYTIQARSNFQVLRLYKSKMITGLVRNLGVYWAEKYFGRGDYLYLSDNDVYFTDGWLDKLIKTLEVVTWHGADKERTEIRHVLVGGSTHPYHGVNREIEIAELGSNYSVHDAVSGYSHLIKWRTWDKYGPMDAHAVGVGQSEDWKFCQDIIEGGGLVGSIWPEVVYATGLTDTFGRPANGAEKMTRYPGVTQE